MNYFHMPRGDPELPAEMLDKGLVNPSSFWRLLGIENEFPVLYFQLSDAGFGLDIKLEIYAVPSLNDSFAYTHVC